MSTPGLEEYLIRRKLKNSCTNLKVNKSDNILKGGNGNVVYIVDYDTNSYKNLIKNIDSSKGDSYFGKVLNRFEEEVNAASRDSYRTNLSEYLKDEEDFEDKLLSGDKDLFLNLVEPRKLKGVLKDIDLSGLNDLDEVKLKLEEVEENINEAYPCNAKLLKEYNKLKEQLDSEYTVEEFSSSLQNLQLYFEELVNYIQGINPIRDGAKFQRFLDVVKNTGVAFDRVSKFVKFNDRADDFKIYSEKIKDFYKLLKSNERKNKDYMGKAISGSIPFFMYTSALITPYTGNIKKFAEEINPSTSTANVVGAIYDLINDAISNGEKTVEYIKDKKILSLFKGANDVLSYRKNSELLKADKFYKEMSGLVTSFKAKAKDNNTIEDILESTKNTILINKKFAGKISSKVDIYSKDKTLLKNVNVEQIEFLGDITNLSLDGNVNNKRNYLFYKLSLGGNSYLLMKETQNEVKREQIDLSRNAYLSMRNTNAQFDDSFFNKDYFLVNGKVSGKIRKSTVTNKYNFNKNFGVLDDLFNKFRDKVRLPIKGRLVTNNSFFGDAGNPEKCEYSICIPARSKLGKQLSDGDILPCKVTYNGIKRKKDYVNFEVKLLQGTNLSEDNIWVTSALKPYIKNIEIDSLLKTDLTSLVDWVSVKNKPKAKTQNKPARAKRLTE